jgi:hypothetical protein
VLLTVFEIRFGGGNHIESNLLFNWVRETSDHGKEGLRELIRGSTLTNNAPLLRLKHTCLMKAASIPGTASHSSQTAPSRIRQRCWKRLSRRTSS